MWTEEKLNDLLTQPSPALVEDMKKIKGNILVLGAGGKMGPTLCILAANAARMAQRDGEITVTAVSRFTDEASRRLLEDHGVTCISCDLLDLEALKNLPDAPNVIYMAGRKFGTDGNEWQTWAMNATLPAFIAEKYKSSRVVVFSSGNLYPIVPISSGGCTEEDAPGPIGEYAMSCLARERAFEYASHRYQTPVFLYRLNFAVDLRYGVLYDMADKILRGVPISLKTPVLNCIWQGTANEIALRGLLHAASPANIVNVTGPETISVKKTALALANALGKEALFEGVEGADAYLNNSAKAMELFGYPGIPVQTLIKWQAQWLIDGGRGLGKPTHFEERKGSY